MSDAVILAVIGGATTVLGGLITVMGNAMIKKMELTRADVAKYRGEVDGHMQKLIEAKEIIANKKGQEENQARTDVKPQGEK